MAFRFGRLLATPGALAAFVESGDNPHTYLRRHAEGDWGDLCAEDKQLNGQALKDGTRILSAYHLSDGAKIWIITEADRSATTILLPNEY